MPIDGGLVVGYLTVALTRAGKRLSDKALDRLLDRLTDVVAARMGDAPIARVATQPRSTEVQREVGQAFDRQIRVDEWFRHEVSDLVAELDRHGGRQLVNNVYAQMNVQAFDHGVAVGRDFNYFHAPDPNDLSQVRPWVKVFIVVGTVLALAGFAIFGYTLFTGMPEVGDPDFGEVPAGIPLAAGVFFAGFVVLAAASVGRGMSQRH